MIGRFAIARALRESATPDARRVIIAKGLRAVADGYVSLTLPAYLLMLGRSPVEIGALMTATLLGSALLTLFAGIITGYFGERRPLVAASMLMVGTGIAFSALTDFWPLLIVAFAGTLNPSSGDVSIFLPLEQSLLARTVSDRDRTLLFALYSVSASLMGALGTLLAGTPDIARASAWTVWQQCAHCFGFMPELAWQLRCSTAAFRRPAVRKTISRYPGWGPRAR